jgi:hypothetical protein
VKVIREKGRKAKVLMVKGGRGKKKVSGGREIWGVWAEK